MTPLNWNDLRCFLAVARCGTYSSAAVKLGATPGTVRRRLASLDEALGARLLRRADHGYALTAAGNAILPHVERVQHETMALLHAAEGSDDRPEGKVRVLVADFVASQLLLPAFAALSQREPKLCIELFDAAEDHPFSLTDHDIAIQQRPFEKPTLIVRSLGSIGFGLYASATYIDAHGYPNFDEACAGHRVIERHDSLTSPLLVSWLLGMTGSAQVALKVAAFETFLSAITNGYGIGVLPRFVAERLPGPGLVRLAPTVPVPTVDLWLGVHREVRGLSRVRHVIDAAVAVVKGQEQQLNPSDVELVTTSASPQESLQVWMSAA